jgi:hypothetical protein
MKVGPIFLRRVAQKVEQISRVQLLTLKVQVSLVQGDQIG